MEVGQMMEIPRHWQRSDQHVATMIEDSFVVLHVESGAYYAFNPSANDIWELLASAVTVEKIADALVEKYDVARDTSLKSIDRILTQLAAVGLAHELE
jgi:hypothetical protein